MGFIDDLKEDFKKDDLVKGGERYDIAAIYFPKKESRNVYRVNVDQMGWPLRFLHVNEDPLTYFIAECCVVGSDLTEQASALYEKFENWHGKMIGGRVASKTWFGRYLPFRKSKIKGIIYYHGVALKKDTMNVTSKDVAACGDPGQAA